MNKQNPRENIKCEFTSNKASAQMARFTAQGTIIVYFI